MSEAWHPIETAPVNVPILVTTEGGHVSIMWKRPNGWVAQCDDYGQSIRSPVALTHWRKVPKPPAHSRRMKVSGTPDWSLAQPAA